MIKPTVKPTGQLPREAQARKEIVHSAYTDRKSKEYHGSVLSQANNTTAIKKLNPTKTKPNSLTVTSYPGLAN